MSGYNQVRHIVLSEPWSEFWVDVRADVKMSYWIEFQETWAIAMGDPRVVTMDEALGYVRDLIVKHNLLTDTGQPHPLTLGEFTPGLLKAVVEACEAAQQGGGEAADPFVPAAPSPAPSSPAPRSRRASRSTASPPTPA